jgi:hypothetical protein
MTAKLSCWPASTPYSASRARSSAARTAWSPAWILLISGRSQPSAGRVLQLVADRFP